MSLGFQKVIRFLWVDVKIYSAFEKRSISLEEKLVTFTIPQYGWTFLWGRNFKKVIQRFSALEV